MKKLTEGLRTLGHWVGRSVDVRDFEFYGGLVLVGLTGGRWPIVGAVLAAHAWLGPWLAARGLR